MESNHAAASGAASEPDESNLVSASSPPASFRGVRALRCAGLGELPLERLARGTIRTSAAILEAAGVEPASRLPDPIIPSEPSPGVMEEDAFGLHRDHRFASLPCTGFIGNLSGLIPWVLPVHLGATQPLKASGVDPEGGLQLHTPRCNPRRHTLAASLPVWFS